MGRELGKGRIGRVGEGDYKTISNTEKTVSSRFLATFTCLKEQSLDPTFELDSQGAILPKTFPAPDGRTDSGKDRLNSESVPGGCFGVRR